MRGVKRGARRNGAYVQTKRGALSRECPKCGAKPGWRCMYRSITSDAYKPIKTFHRERYGEGNGAQE